MVLKFLPTRILNLGPVWCGSSGAPEAKKNVIHYNTLTWTQNAGNPISGDLN